jgi:hypothetical protein
MSCIYCGKNLDHLPTCEYYQPSAASAGYRFEPLTQFGQIKRGDLIIVRNVEGEVTPVIVADIVQAGTETDEIITDKRKNSYFIVSMYLAGQSWVKDCQIFRER